MDITPGLLGILAPFPMLLFFFFLMFTGRIVSGKRADRELDRLSQQWESEKKALTEQWASEKRDLLKQSDDRVAETREVGQNWREAHHTSEEIRANVAAQMETLRVNSEVAVRVLTALPGALSIPAAITGAERQSRPGRHD